ncbi:MAG: hypothetical protein Q9225_002629 [Loekoesia sp. 1 TL-2023]
MYQSTQILVLAVLAAFSSAAPQSTQGQRGIDGYGTFNKYSTQNSVNCEADYFKQKGVTLTAGNTGNKIFGAATSDVSNGLGPFKCNYTPSDSQHNSSKCIAPQQGTSYKLPTYDSYIAPFCPGAPCGKCYTITNKANNKKITVQIIDSCPADTAWNYCKALASNPSDNVSADQRCADPNTNQVDIDESAYPFLTDGQSYQSVKAWEIILDLHLKPECYIHAMAYRNGV